MKIMIALAASAAAVALSGCATGLPGTAGSNFDINAFLNSTTCAHKDSVSGVTGAAGIPASLQFSASRECPAVGATVPATTGVVVGQTVGGAADPGPTPH